MVRVKVKIESRAIGDPYLRYHGLAVDEDLPGDFWVSKPHTVIGVTGRYFTFEREFDLPPGVHTLEYGVSCFVGCWLATIYIDGREIAEEEVRVDRHLKVELEVKSEEQIQKEKETREKILTAVVTASTIGVVGTVTSIAVSRALKK